MKTPRIFIRNTVIWRLLMTILLIASSNQVSAATMERPISITRIVRPFLGDPEEPGTGPVPEMLAPDPGTEAYSTPLTESVELNSSWDAWMSSIRARLMAFLFGSEGR
jgi:hypothetical protein